MTLTHEQIVRSIKAIHSDADFDLFGEEIITWRSSVAQPTEAEIVAKWDEIKNYVETTPPTDPVPMRVTLAQARAALIAAGLFDTINAYVTSSNDATLKTAWEYSNTVSRHGHFVTTMAPVFGLTDAQLDDLFRAANKIDF